MYESFPVAAVPKAERYDYFVSVVDQLFCPMETEPLGDPRDFQGRIDASAFGQVQLACVETSPVLVQRRTRDIGRLTTAPYLIKFQLEGEAHWSQRGKDVHLRPGDFVICSTAEPYSLRFDGPYRMPVLALAEGTMRRLTPHPDRFLGERMPGDDACCGLLSSFVADVVRSMAALPAPMVERVETNILDLLGGVLSARAGGNEIERVPSADLIRRMKGFVRDNLRNRRLGPAMVAGAFGVSTRYVHKLFASEAETLARYVRSQRLEASRRMLSDPSFSQMSITDIALYWGFYDLSHMTRSFRGAFGVSPRDYRAGAQRIGNA